MYTYFSSCLSRFFIYIRFFLLQEILQTAAILLINKFFVPFTERERALLSPLVIRYYCNCFLILYFKIQKRKLFISLLLQINLQLHYKSITILRRPANKSLAQTSYNKGWTVLFLTLKSM